MLQNILGNKSYLVVDDLGDMRATLRTMLSLFGVTDIDNARNGAEAIQRMEKKRYQVVLCDYNLGTGKDGQQVLEEARHRNLISISTTFIMVTAENTLGMVLGALEYEPDGYLYKPFTKDLLRNRLHKLLSRKMDLRPVDEALEHRDYDTAVKLLDQRIDGKPKHLTELLRLKAEICLRSGAYEAAHAIYETVLAARELTWARLGLGRVQYGLKQYEAARLTFQEVIDGNDRYTAAYDWLSRTLKRLGDLHGSQEVLTAAVKISPKAILRQQELGEIALENRDFRVAEKAFDQAVGLGKHSIHKHPKLFAKLAESQVSNQHHKNKRQAFKVIERMRREFKDNREADFYAAISLATTHRELGEEEQAAESLQQAERLYGQIGLQTNPDAALSMAKTHARLGNEEQAKRLFQTAIKNNHDDDEFLRNLAAAYNETGISTSASVLIDETRKEVIALNNKGVGLVEKGRIEAATGLFEKAAEGLSGNKAINLNAAKVLIMSMEKHGVDPNKLANTRRYLERVQKHDPDYKGLPKLLERLKKLLGRMD